MDELVVMSVTSNEIEEIDWVGVNIRVNALETGVKDLNRRYSRFTAYENSNRRSKRGNPYSASFTIARAPSDAFAY